MGAAEAGNNGGLIALATILAIRRIAVDPDQLRHGLGHFEACSSDDLLRTAKRHDGVRAKAVTARRPNNY
jgi:subfamily B ATP-binding cassette protein HlyB/CyaB